MKKPKTKGQANIPSQVITIVILGALILVGGLLMQEFNDSMESDFKNTRTVTNSNSTNISGTATNVTYAVTNSTGDAATLDVAFEIVTDSEINVSIDNNVLATLDGTSPTEVAVDSQYVPEGDDSVKVEYTPAGTSDNVTSHNLTYTQDFNDDYGSTYENTTENMITGFDLMTIAIILVAAGAMLTAIYTLIMR